MKDWPELSSICLDCRTLLDDGRECPRNPKHRVRSLRDPLGRQDLLHAVWGPPGVRKTIQRTGTAGAVGGATGSAFEACAGADLAPLDPEGAVVIAAAAVVFMVAYAAASPVIRWYRRERHRALPSGAPRRQPLLLGPSSPPVARGTIVADAPQRRSPLSGRRCCGYEVLFSHRTSAFGGGAVTLRHAVTLGFDIDLDDGSRARVPAGVLVLQAPAGRASNADDRAVERYLRTVDNRRRDSDDLDPFPRQRIGETLLQPGQRVELVGELTRVADARAAPAGGYRDAAPSVLVPRDVPRIRLPGRGSRA